MIYVDKVSCYYKGYRTKESSKKEKGFPIGWKNKLKKRMNFNFFLIKRYNLK